MPLPKEGMPWPPNKAAFARHLGYDAWYSGDPDRLGRAYTRASGVPQNHPSQYRGGILGWAARTFWGAPIPDGERRNKLHVPLPADIATASSDLLFAKPPTVKWTRPKNQERWERLDDQLKLRSRLHEAAEVCAAMEGVYLRSGWDTEIADHALLQAVHADHAIPTFVWGRLQAVTFWHEVERDGDKVWRYLNVHEMRGEARKLAVEENALYLGTSDKIGVRKQLTAHTATMGLPDVVARGLPVLPVSYVPNMLPSREDRGSDLGRSDFEGVLPLFDALDETFTSWMRDVRLAKGRIIVPSSYLQSLGPGQGAVFDLDREVYEGLQIAPTQVSGNPITLQQFAIRVAEHEQTMLRIIRQAVGTAGYSGQTFGLDETGGGEQTATEVNDRRNRSLLTREKKTAYWGEGIQQTAAALLWIERIVFGRTDLDPEDIPAIQWPDGASVDQLKLAQTTETLDRARAVSIETKVRMVNPDWSDPEVAAEVERIKVEQGIGVEDPGRFRGDAGPPAPPTPPADLLEDAEREG
ncbi:hypothetical protein SUDANB95_05509 [Actinosynnema sp. ALI-1.44]